MHGQDRDEDESHSPRDQRSNTHDYDYGQPVFTSPSQQNPIYTGPILTANTPPHVLAGLAQGQIPIGQNITTLPPISISSGLPPINFPVNSQGMTISGPPVTLPPSINVPGGIIMGPPISLPSSGFPPGVQGGFISGVPNSFSGSFSSNTPIGIPAGIQTGIPGGIPINYRQQSIRGPLNTNVIQEMVPRSQFQKCAQQCQIWEMKYKQLNNKYLNLMRQKGSSQPHDLSRLRQQNYQLQQRIAGYQSAQRQLSSNIQSYISGLINKYKQSTLRETALLFDRFKLQCRAHQKNP